MGIEQVRRNWGWFLALGIALIVLGTLGLGYAALLTFTSVLFFGILLLFSSVFQLVNAFQSRQWSGFFLHLLAGVLELIVGLFAVTHPLEAGVELTLVLAVFLIVGGIFRIVGSVMLQFPNWGWALLGGVISVLLGLMLWRQWPWSGVVFIGLCVAIDLIFHGWGWVMFALAIRSRPAAEVPPTSGGPAT
jgi:uncharacterized membrane protein HdeD (DUF308 family)